MTKILLILPILLFANLAFSQVVKKDSCVLTIRTGRIEKRHNQRFWVIPAKLTNKSRDTLSYFSMSCSEQDFYSVDNEELKIETVLRDKNVPVIIMLAPGRSEAVEIRILINPPIDASVIKFKVGFNLLRADKSQKTPDLNYAKEQKRKNIIWSNVISVKKNKRPPNNEKNIWCS